MKHPRQTRRLSATVACAALSAACALGAAPAAWAKDAPEPVAVDAAFNATEMAGTLTRVTEAATLKGVTRVAVPQFSVQFVTRDSASAETSGFGAAGRARVTSNYLLQGVSEAEFQAMVEALYAGFLRDLRASGLEVLEFAQVAASPSYPKLAASGVPAPLRGDDQITVAPAGMSLYGANRVVATTTKKSGGVLAAFSGFGTAMSMVGSIGDSVALAKELGGVALLEVHMRVDFVELTNNNKGFFGRLSSTASVSAKTAPAIGSATMGVMVGAMSSQLTLSNPLTLDSSAFSEVREQAKTGADVAGAVLTGLIKLASGSKDSSEYSTMEAVADPKRYGEIVGGGLGQVNQLFVQRLKSER